MGKNDAKSGPLADRLRRAIKASGLSLSELARRSGVDHSRLSRFVRAERDLTLDAVDRLCATLGVVFTTPETAEQPAAPTDEPPPAAVPPPRGRPRKDAGPAEPGAKAAKRPRKRRGG